MLLIVGGLIIAIGAVIIIWDVLVLIGCIVQVVAGVIILIFTGIALGIQKLYEWKKERSGQGWESIQTEVGGDQYASTQNEYTTQNEHVVKMSMSLEDAAKFAGMWKGDIVINVVDDDASNVRPMRDITPRRKRLK
jgi:hypothetical protein